MKKVRYAVVGTGYISQDAFMPSVDGTGNSCMTAIISGNPEGSRKLANFYGIPHVYDYSEYDAALASGNFDAVYIALPNSMHAEYTIRAARHGIHALVEKPLAINAQECREMIEAAHANNTALMTAYRLHCVPGMIEPIKLIQEGAIGEVNYIMSALSVKIPQDNHRWQAEHWGGPLQDLGVYCLNAARNIFGGEPIEAIAISEDRSNDPAREIDETISVILSFSNGRIASFTSSFASADKDILLIVGSEGEMEITPAFRAEAPIAAKLTKNGKVTEIEMQDTDHFGSQTAYFSDCILTGKRVKPDGAEGLADVIAMEAIERAAKTGQVQKIENDHQVNAPDRSMFTYVVRTDRRLYL